MKNSHFFPKNTFVHFKFIREGFQVMLYGLMMKGKNCKVYDGKWSRGISRGSETIFPGVFTFRFSARGGGGLG